MGIICTSFEHPSHVVLRRIKPASIRDITNQITAMPHYKLHYSYWAADLAAINAWRHDPSALVDRTLPKLLQRAQPTELCTECKMARTKWKTNSDLRSAVGVVLPPLEAAALVVGAADDPSPPCDRRPYSLKKYALRKAYVWCCPHRTLASVVTSPRSSANVRSMSSSIAE